MATFLIVFTMAAFLGVLFYGFYIFEHDSL